MTFGSLVRRRGAVSSLALAASGASIALQPRQAATALGLTATQDRGIAETRIGLGGTFVGLGVWSLSRRSQDAYRAVGATWLGAAVTRLITLQVDDPDPDWTFWAYLVAEVALGLGGLSARSSKSSRSD